MQNCYYSATREGKYTTHTKPRMEVIHEGKDHPRGERGTVNHTLTNTTACPRVGFSPVKGVGWTGGPADVAERLPERHVHYCAPGLSYTQRRK